MGLAGHDRKLWAELDFVVITERAVVCLEVKGGRISVDRQTWSTNGKRLSHSPFEQAGGGASALRRFLTDELDDAPVVAWGVLFPDCELDIRAPWAPRELYYDERDRRNPMHTFIDRVIDHALREGRSRERTAELDAVGKEQILDLVAPSFELLPTLRARVEGIHDDLVRLTSEQAGVLRGFEDDDRLLVRGGAGSGKTMLAAAEVERLAWNGRSVVLCCVSSRLAADLRFVLGASPEVEVTSVIEEAATDLAAAGRADALPAASRSQILAVELPEHALAARRTLSRRTFDALVVDEAQDLLSRPWLDYLDSLVAGGLVEGTWRFFLDPNQDLLLGGDPEQLARLDGLARSRYRLTRNCRNTRQVALSSALLTALGTLETLEVDGPEVEQHYYRDRATERARAASVVRDWISGGIRSADIVVLAPTGLKDSAFAGVGESELGAPLVDIALYPAGSAPDGVRFSSIGDFKGLEAEAVLLLGIDDLSSGARRLELYVGLTRARALLAVMIDESAQAAHDELAADFGRRLRRGEIRIR